MTSGNGFNVNSESLLMDKVNFSSCFSITQWGKFSWTKVLQKKNTFCYFTVMILIKAANILFISSYWGHEVLMEAEEPLHTYFQT